MFNAAAIGDREDDGILVRQSAPRAENVDDPQRADGSKHEARCEHEGEIECARPRRLHHKEPPSLADDNRTVSANTTALSIR